LRDFGGEVAGCFLVPRVIKTLFQNGEALFHGGLAFGGRGIVGTEFFGGHFGVVPLVVGRHKNSVE